MPELPEVEFARRSLRTWLVGAELTLFTADARILDGAIARARRHLVGRRVRAIDRRGKWLRITLDEGLLFSHLGMTGKWVRADAQDAPLRSERLRLDARRGRKSVSVRYLDPRLFGRVVVTDADLPEWLALGPDPLVDGIDADALHVALQRRKLAIKPTLMDQALLAGLGNIQVQEALYFARIDPRRPARTLSLVEVRRLVRAIHRTLSATLAHERGPRITYVEEAGAENPFTIYGRGGEPCPSCAAALTRIVLSGRGTVFCRVCQK